MSRSCKVRKLKAECACGPVEKAGRSVLRDTLIQGTHRHAPTDRPLCVRDQTMNDTWHLSSKYPQFSWSDRNQPGAGSMRDGFETPEVYLFSVAALTNRHSLSDLKPYESIIVKACRLEVPRASH